MTDTKTSPKVENHAPEYDLEALLEAGCHFGHQVKRWHPKMAPYIYTAKNGVHIFDLAKTAEQMQLAYNRLYQLGKEGKQVIFVGTKRQAREIVKTSAKENGAMYIVSRWLGGLLTNWQQVGKSLKKMLKIEEDQEKDEYKNYTKYERVQIDKDRIRLERFFGGIRDMKKAPAAIFVVDPKREINAVLEAEKMGVEVIALADTDADPVNIDIVIPANDDAIASIELIVTEMAKAYGEGRKAK
ncbi:MAG: 30S ribosomal protein S2 [Patescibacteria group bacterium]